MPGTSSRSKQVEEIKNNTHDKVGISSIQTNLIKVRNMCKLILPCPMRPLSSVAASPTSRAEAEFCSLDHIALGDGALDAKLLARTQAPLRHPQVLANINTRIMGVNLRNHPGDVAATLIPSAGCPGLQFLFNVRNVRRQREIHQVLRRLDKRFLTSCASWRLTCTLNRSLSWMRISG